MPARLKLTIAYDGPSFAGWQSQAHGKSVQDHLERAFLLLTGRKITVHGAGRTDAGVHALAQCAHADVPDRARPAAIWLNALNATLPAKIRVLRCRYVSEKFHARFSASGKIYRYRIWAAPVLPPWELDRAWHLRAPLDFAAMQRAAKVFAGRHDFARFAANRGHAESDTMRHIKSIGIKRSGALITITIQGDGFLYKMVRLMVGAIVQCGIGKRSAADVRAQLEKTRTDPARVAAPAAGLALVRVIYNRSR